MRAYLTACLFAASMMSAFAALEPVGKVLTLKGSATAVAEDSTRRDLATRADIFLNDRILTGADSRVQIMMLDDTVITQASNGDMLIDEYSFDPQDKSRNATRIKMAKGLFRVITGKITDLNPKAFEVRTSLATIGIRGCSVLCDVGEEETIGIEYVPRGKSIEIRLLNDGTGRKGFPRLGGRKITVTKPGVSVHINKNRKMKREALSPDLSKGLAVAAPPAPPLRTDPPPAPNTGSPKPAGDGHVLNKAPERRHGLQPQILHEGTLRKIVQKNPDAFIRKIAPAAPPKPKPKPSGDAPPIGTGQLAFLNQGGNACWTWGVWAYENGVPDRVELFTRNPISNIELQHIFDNAMHLDLVSIPGSMTVEGILKTDNRSRRVTRLPDSLNVIDVFINSLLHGTGWKAVFTMGNEFGDRVDIRISNAFIAPNGSLRAPAGTLQGFVVRPGNSNVPYLREHITFVNGSGHLSRGPDPYSRPVAGISGRGFFEFNNEANGPGTLQMIFGAKLQDRAYTPPPPTDF